MRPLLDAIQNDDVDQLKEAYKSKPQKKVHLLLAIESGSRKVAEYILNERPRRYVDFNVTLHESSIWNLIMSRWNPRLFQQLLRLCHKLPLLDLAIASQNVEAIIILVRWGAPLIYEPGGSMWDRMLKKVYFLDWARANRKWHAVHVLEELGAQSNPNHVRVYQTLEEEIELGEEKKIEYRWRIFFRDSLLERLIWTV